mgnify:CR=1 FL=1
MMEEQLYITALYDYYANLLTEKQRGYFEEYYFDNLTMEEIATNMEISKNAVSKCLMEVKEKLEFYEHALHLYENKQKIKKALTKEELDKIVEFI